MSLCLLLASVQRLQQVTCDYKHLFIQIVLSVDRLSSSPFWFPLFFNGFTCWMTHYWLGVWLKSVKMNCKLLSLTVLPYSIHHITKLLFYFIWPLPWSVELRRMTSWNSRTVEPYKITLLVALTLILPFIIYILLVLHFFPRLISYAFVSILHSLL